MKKNLLIISVLIWLTPNLIFSQVITNGLIGYWPFSGNANDLISNNNGNIGAASSADKYGNSNSAYSFDGVDDGISIPYNSILDMALNDMSFSMWVKAETVQPNTPAGLIYHGATNDVTSGYWMRIEKTTGLATYYLGNGTTRITGSSTISVLDNTWHHIVYTFDRDGLGIIYIDGQNRTTNGGYSISSFSSNNLAQSTLPVYFAYKSYFKGSMDEIMIFNRVLTPAEVQMLYSSHSLTVTSGSGSGTYAENEVISISANIAPVGYIFDKWTGDTSYVADPLAEETTITIPVGNINLSLTATYKLIWAHTGSTIYYTGKVAIGREDVPSGYNLAVDGKIITKEIKVTVDNWSDFVFNTNYPLMPINQLENFIIQNNHLPLIPNESEIKKDGVNVGEMNAKLLQKIEELTLYVIEQDKKIEALDNKIKELESVSK